MTSRAKPCPFDKSTPNIIYDVPFMNRYSIPASEDGLGKIVIGASGSGKTVAGVIPVVRALCAHRNEFGKPTAVIYNDDKGESESPLTKYLSDRGELERLIKTFELGRPFNLFEFTGTKCIDSVVQAIVRTAGLETGDGDSKVWAQKAIQLFTKMVQVESVCAELRSFLRTELKSNGIVKNVSALGLITLIVDFLDPDFITSQGCTLEQLLKTLLDSDCFLQKISNENLQFFPSMMKLMQIISVCSPENKKSLKGIHYLFEIVLKPYPLFLNPVHSGSDRENFTQHMYYFLILQPMLQRFGDSTLAQFVNLDPFKDDVDSEFTSFRNALDTGRVILHQRLSHSQFINETASSVLRTLLCQYLRDKSDPYQVVGYVGDEFHNYMSTDKDFGEVSLLSWARAFRCICLFSTQSISALLNRARELSPAAGESAVKALLTNLPNKMVFRSNEYETQEWAERTIGKTGGILKMSTLESRPLNSLNSGDYHYITGEGNKGFQNALPIHVVHKLENGESIVSILNSGHPKVALKNSGIPALERVVQS